jgi:hypothetical protein
MDPLAEMTPDDLAGFWRPLSDAETTVATNLIDVLSSIIRGRLPSIDLWITEGLVDPKVVQFVMSTVIAQIIQVTNRASAAKMESRTLGSSTYTVSYYDTTAVQNQATALLTPDLITLLVPPSFIVDNKPVSSIYQQMPMAGNELRGWYGNPVPTTVPDGIGTPRRRGLDRP